MANNIKGITIQIGGDTTGLDKALKGVNSQAKSAQNELKEVNKALKLDPGNTELLEQKQRALAAAVSATAEKLQTLKEAQKQAADQLARGDIGQEQYDALTREVVKTEAELKKATKAQEEFNVKAEEASAKLTDVGNKAQAVADKTKALSTAAAGLLVAIGGAAVKSAEWADNLNTLSQQTGITTEDLQKMQYASELVDVSVDDIAGSMTKLRKAMVADNKADVFQQLGVSVRDSTGALRDSSDVFYDVLDRLGKVGNETERDALAMEIFGRSADQLAGIIDDGGAALKQLGEEAEQLGIILDQDTLDAMNKVNDEIERLKAQAKGEFAKAGAAALEALTPLLEDVVAALAKVLEFIGNLNPQVIKVVAVIAAVVAAISPVAAIIAKIAGLLSTLTTMFPVIGTALAALTGPIGLIVAGIVGLVAAIAILAKAIYENWDKIKAAAIAFKNKVVATFNEFKAKVMATFNSIRDAIVRPIQTAIDKVKAIIQKVKSFFPIKVGNIFSSIKLPHLSISGKLSLNPPSVPKISIDWYKTGGIFDNPSVIGVGEAGSEAVVPLSKLWEQMDRQNAQLVSAIITAMRMNNVINNQPIVINLGGAKVAEVVYKLNKQGQMIMEG